MEKKSFVLKGNIVYSGENKELCSIEGGYVVCENGICRGAFEKLPKQYETLPLTDYGDKIILPGMTGSACACTTVYVPGTWHGS